MTGFFSTLVNVYSVQDGQWSITACISGVVSGVWMLLSVSVYVLYQVLLRNLD